jgi:AcrR family transcriptional regulator
VVGPVVGLRERNKARTKAEIQRHALRLFREQGYANTTVDQIAAAAEVSPSTFFRYFPTKEDVVLGDDYDPILIAAFHAQPPEVTPIQAIRRAMRSVFDNLSAEDLAQERERHELVQAVPELRARALDSYAEVIQLLATAVAKRVGRKPDDVAVLAFAGAVIGVAVALSYPATVGEGADYFALMDEGLAQLEAGLPL